MIKTEFNDAVAQPNINIQDISIFGQDTNSGKWTDDENLRYVIFLDYHKGQLASRQKRRSYGVFVQMSKFVLSRSAVQCRSHHQKLEQKFINFRKIISCFKCQMGKQKYKKKFQELTEKYAQILEFSEVKTENQEKPAQHGIQTQISGFNCLNWNYMHMNPYIYGNMLNGHLMSPQLPPYFWGIQ